MILYCAVRTQWQLIQIHLKFRFWIVESDRITKSPAAAKSHSSLFINFLILCIYYFFSFFFISLCSFFFRSLLMSLFFLFVRSVIIRFCYSLSEPFQIPDSNTSINCEFGGVSVYSLSAESNRLTMHALNKCSTASTQSLMGALVRGTPTSKM